MEHVCGYGVCTMRGVRTIVFASAQRVLPLRLACRAALNRGVAGMELGAARPAMGLRSPALRTFGTPCAHLHALGHRHAGLVLFCYTGLAVALLTFLPRALPEGQRWAAAVLPFVGMAGTFGAGWLTRRQSPLQLLRWIYPAMGLSSVLCALAITCGWGYTSAALLLMGVSGLAGGAAFALIPALNKDAAQQARANGAVAQMGNLGATLGPPTFALALSQQPAWGLALPVVALATLGWVILGWGRRHHAMAH